MWTERKEIRYIRFTPFGTVYPWRHIAFGNSLVMYGKAGRNLE